MKTPKLKLKSAVTGKYTKATGADPAKTYKSDDYPARQLRKLVRMMEKDGVIGSCTLSFDTECLITAIRKRMGWK